MPGRVLRRMLSRVRGLFPALAGPASRSRLRKESPTHNAITWASQLTSRPSSVFSESPSRRLLREMSITRSLRVCPLTRSADDAFAHVAEATRDKEWIYGLDIRRLGDRLSKDEVKAAGARGNAILSRQFLDILTEQGRDNPMVAADVLAAMINRGIDSAYYLTDPSARVVVEASNMASGPCAAVVPLDGAEIAAASASLFPLDACTHPQQCACRYRFPRQQDESIDLSPEEQALADQLVEQLLGGITIRVGPETSPRQRPNFDAIEEAGGEDRTKGKLPE